MSHRIAITHHELGIFVGHGMGLAFFTLLDCAGQSCVVTFESVEAAAILAEECDNFGVAREDLRFVTVRTKRHPTYAYADDLREAGFGDLIGELEQNELREIAESRTVQ